MTKHDDMFDRIKGLERRLKALEGRTDSGRSSEVEGVDSRRFCGMPAVPERTFAEDVTEERARLIRIISKKWVNGTKLKYFFFDPVMGAHGDPRDVVRAAFDEWKDVGIGLEFEETGDPQDAEIRIGFQRGDGAWSYVGRDVLLQGSSERTMNFGWDITGDDDGRDTALHEIGHTLGFPHEHQNPLAGIVWDEEAVYAALAGSPNFWSRDKTFFNIIRKIPRDTVEGSEWDPDSIMHYPFGAGMIEQPPEYRGGLRPAGGLSDTDKAQVRLFYPPLEPEHELLVPYRCERMRITPGQQANFRIEPAATREFTMQTFGDSDVVAVLFEDDNGELRFVEGDDDSGFGRNATLRVRLYRGRKYVLRVRLFYSSSHGDSAVMIW